MFVLTYIEKTIKGTKTQRKDDPLFSLRLSLILWDYKLIRYLFYYAYFQALILRIFVAPYLIFTGNFSTNEKLTAMLYPAYMLYALIASTKYISNFHVPFVQIIDNEFLPMEMFDEVKRKEINAYCKFLNKANLCLVLTIPVVIQILYNFTVLSDIIHSAFVEYKDTYLYHYLYHTYFIEGNLLIVFGSYSTSLFVYYALHQLIQIKLLCERFNSLETDMQYIKDKVDSEFFQKVIHERLYGCISYYTTILKFHNELKAYYETIFLLKYYVLLLLFIMDAYVYFFVKQESVKQVVALLFLVTLTFLSVYVIMGQLILDESQRLAYIVSNAKWYNWNRQNKKDYLIFTMVLCEPLTIDVKCVQQMNLTFYILTIKGAYTVIMAMFSLNIFEL